MNYDDFKHIDFDRRPDGVLLATLNRPEVMNATNARLHWELSKLWNVINDDASVKVVVVTGAGDRAFSAGGDLEWIEGMIGDPEVVTAVMKEVADIVYNMLACEKPIISAINGTAVGAGLAVALLADVSVIAEDATFTDGHARIGVAAGDHAAIVWPLLCGMAKAKYYLMTADFINGREAERLGLVTFAVARDELMERAMAIAAKLARGSQTAIRGTKKALNNWMYMAGPIFDASLGIEMLGFLGADAREGLDAVRNKRAPDFPSARLP
ncbi:enoyl-CoA hydratase/isomerase family protein [Bordetella bronchiseptica]|uniref:Enoyl-CoA hydratase/isomerase family n=1 Tax=Bordetella bronchiseptica (strain ATCC BAA-588 / NCTC 13252 / RB50) TaxID=257310 RepID=A0A0H3LQJ1_BORBR|nr:enoyl-CoA hydratase/isomerase family protein [Bordetella bronchiseptica]KAK60844.1 enoyl-CoA hydratase/isomerase family protein [Bordetella bronchiseptica 980-2]AMG87128.1 enoyl-CoA hydratase [Bordetella bronchiseptica]KCV48944.1 enoyl-CoA hydratase/isomerase family protein [Bordetella bronchiseptica 3E44]KCV54975.1 enoyl-CoA hydratase/isomerase family protein [Bordetella bronchiseptica 980]KDB88022.1 enoyl-CoA hydratase/isomerase family protein [Bordetella bronchiseptica D989]